MRGLVGGAAVAAAMLAAVIATVMGTGLAARAMSRGGVPHYVALPARPHAALGPVRALAQPVRPEEEAAVPIATAARSRYGAVDALALVRREPLPNGAAMIVAVALRWR